MRHSDWRPISDAPVGTTVIVGNKTEWTLARLVYTPIHRIQLKWPFFKNSVELTWIFSCSGWRPIPFIPTHWMSVEFLVPPEDNNGEEATDGRRAA